MEGKSFFENISELRENLLKFVETKVSYYGLVAFEKSAKLFSSLISSAVIILILLLSLIFFSGAAGLYLGQLLESYLLGLLIVGGFYLLLGIVFIIFRKKIFGPMVIKSMAETFFQDDDDEQSR